MQPTLFEQALDLLVFGMGTVFVFLAILVIAINLMSRFVGTFFPEAIVPEATRAPAKPVTGELDNTTLAVIQAAIRQHRDRQNSNN
ncbi:OadG family protein [Cellvibrio sp. OA-2007]|uniref:OadG family protein n=1 Tax=Cellvibrio sp. OA-2007 TaxID=529823 RepID=UPI000781D1B2|nr:OadG family protein [Cellvibrio sp. OA-2007]